MEIKRPKMFVLAQEGKVHKLWQILLTFTIVFTIAGTLKSVPSLLVLLTDNNMLSGYSLSDIVSISTYFQEKQSYLYSILFGTVFLTIVSVIYCHFIEKRSLRSMGLCKQHIVRSYLLGLFIGFVMFSMVIIINVITSSMTFEIEKDKFSSLTWIYIVLFLFGFIIQGASEEIIIRGYLMTSIGANYSIRTSVIISSVFFSFIHIGNSELALISIINFTLMGVFLALYIICFDNIWGACAIHGMWNFIQGSLYGVNVSGVNIPNSIFNAYSAEEKVYINGGDFGAEGGLAVTIVMLLFLMLLLLYMRKSERVKMD